VPKQLPEHWRELGTFIREQRSTARLSLRRLSELAPIDDARVFLTTGGGESIDTEATSSTPNSIFA